MKYIKYNWVNKIEDMTSEEFIGEMNSEDGPLTIEDLNEINNDKTRE